MIRAVPRQVASNYLNTMGMSWLLNTIITAMFFGAILSPLGFLFLTLITDWCWWRVFKHANDL